MLCASARYQPTQLRQPCGGGIQKPAAVIMVYAAAHIRDAGPRRAHNLPNAGVFECSFILSLPFVTPPPTHNKQTWSAPEAATAVRSHPADLAG